MVNSRASEEGHGLEAAFHSGWRLSWRINDSSPAPAPWPRIRSTTHIKFGTAWTYCIGLVLIANIIFGHIWGIHI